MEPKRKTGAWKPFVVRRPVVSGLAIAFVVALLLHTFQQLNRSEEQSPITRPRAQYFDDSKPNRGDVGRSQPSFQDFAVTSHLDSRLRELTDDAVTCLQGSCSHELAACRNDKLCRVALRHFTRKCWEEDTLCEELSRAGLLVKCPVTFHDFFQCYNKACHHSRSDSMLVDRHKPYYFAEATRKISEKELLSLAAEAQLSLDDANGREAHLNIEKAEGLLEKVISAAEEADQISSWGVGMALQLVGKARPSLYTAKVFAYSTTDVPLRLRGSREFNSTYALVTVAIALPSEESSSGTEMMIRVKSPCGPKESHIIFPGGMLIFESWRDYDIVPSERDRQILLIEFWENGALDDFEFLNLEGAFQEVQQRSQKWFAKRLLQNPRS